MDERIVRGDFHRLLIVMLCVFVISVPFRPLVGEGLDDLDAAESLFERRINDGHAFHRTAIRSLERLCQPADSDGRNRRH